MHSKLGILAASAIFQISHLLLASCLGTMQFIANEKFESLLAKFPTFHSF